MRTIGLGCSGLSSVGSCVTLSNLGAAAGTGVAASTLSPFVTSATSGSTAIVVPGGEAVETVDGSKPSCSAMSSSVNWPVLLIIESAR